MNIMKNKQIQRVKVYNKNVLKLSLAIWKRYHSLW